MVGISQTAISQNFRFRREVWLLAHDDRIIEERLFEGRLYLL